MFILATFVLTSGYRGSLISFLTAPHRPEPLDTLQDVVESPHVVSIPIEPFHNFIASKSTLGRFLT